MGFQKTIQTPRAPKAVGPYSQAIEINGTIYCSGQIPLTASGELIDSSIEAATEQVIKNLDAVLQKAGSALSDVVKTTIFLKDLNDFDAVNGVYEAHFYKKSPARSTVEVSHLPKGAMVEIEAIAVMASEEEKMNHKKGGCGDDCSC